MADNEKTSEPAAPAAVEGTPPTPPRRSPGHRGADVKDTVAEMAAKAHEISLEAGSRMAAAMKDVVNAAAGLTDFVVESARDLVQFMVRRGQMTQDEADKLLDQVEASQPKRKAPPPPPVKPNVTSAAPAMLRPVVNAPIPPKKTTSTAKSPSKPAKAAKPAVKAKTPPKKAAAKQAPPKKSASKPATKKVTAKKSAAKAPAKKSAKKPAAKKSAKASRK